jgi:hypothetical protein
MFFGASSFNQDLSSWVPAAAVTMDEMFASSNGVQFDIAFDRNLCSWVRNFRVPTTVSVNRMFDGSSCPVQADPNPALQGNGNVSPWCVSC